MRCHMAFAEDKTGTNAYPQILEQLKENGKLIEPVLVIFTSDNANFGWYSRMLSNSFPNATVIGSTSAVFYSPEGIAKEWSAQPESAYYQTNLEEYLACELGYSLDNINYMVSAENVPVYDGTTPIGDKEPLLYL